MSEGEVEFADISSDLALWKVLRSKPLSTKNCSNCLRIRTPDPLVHMKIVFKASLGYHGSQIRFVYFQAYFI